jgi:hypothetical protein
VKKLQDVTDFKVMSFKECISELGWNLHEDEESFNVECNCGNSQIEYSGFFSTEVVECQNCGKRITDLFSPLQTGNATCTMLNPKDYEIEKDLGGNDRYWIAEDRSGGIKL